MKLKLRKEAVVKVHKYIDCDDAEERRELKKELEGMVVYEQITPNKNWLYEAGEIGAKIGRGERVFYLDQFLAKCPKSIWADVLAEMFPFK